MSSFFEELEGQTSSAPEVFIVAFRNVIKVYNADGSVLKSYDRCDVKERTFGLIDEYYMISAANAHPNVRILPFTRVVHSPALDFTVPGKPTVLTVSNCSRFCALAVDKALYLFQLNGQFIFSKVPCFTKITCMKFDSQSRHIIAGAESGKVKFISVVFYRQGDLSQACADDDFTYYHNCAVVDIFVQNLAIEHEVISFDKIGEIKIIKDRSIIASITLHTSFTALITDCFQQVLCFGTETGQVGKLPIQHVAASFTKYTVISDEDMVDNVHRSAVLKLCLSPSSNDFASCGDKRIIIWNLTPLTPKMTFDIAEFPLGFYWIVKPKPFFNKEFRPHFPVKKFDKIDATKNAYRSTPDVSLTPETAEDYSFSNFFQLDF